MGLVFFLIFLKARFFRGFHFFNLFKARFFGCFHFFNLFKTLFLGAYEAGFVCKILILWALFVNFYEFLWIFLRFWNEILGICVEIRKIFFGNSKRILKNSAKICKFLKNSKVFSKKCWFIILSLRKQGEKSTFKIKDNLRAVDTSLRSVWQVVQFNVFCKKAFKNSQKP